MDYRYGDSMTEQELIEVMLEERIDKADTFIGEFAMKAMDAGFLLHKLKRLNRIIFELEQIDG